MNTENNKMDNGLDLLNKVIKSNEDNIEKLASTVSIKIFFASCKLSELNKITPPDSGKYFFPLHKKFPFEKYLSRYFKFSR